MGKAIRKENEMGDLISWDPDTDYEIIKTTDPDGSRERAMFEKMKSQIKKTLTKHDHL